MSLYEFEGRRPEIGPGAWVAPDADIIGDVKIGPGCYIGWGAILRGDYGTIEIGEGTAIEEGVIVHARPDDKTSIGREVTVGHGAMIHNATIGDFAVIGMRAVVSDYARVGEWTIIGEMGLVRSRQEVPPRVIAFGQPVTVKGPIREIDEQMWSWAKKLYQGLAERYPKGLKPMDGG